MKNIILAVSAFVGVAALPQPAFAWGEQGHSIVCELAYRNLTETSRDNVGTLLKAWAARHGFAWANTNNKDLLYKRFMNSCMFEDVVKNRKGLGIFKDQPGHFVNYPRTKQSVPDNEAVCSRNSSNQEVKCIFRVLERDLSTFRNQSAEPADRAEAMIGIGHWLGDIHQPLHVSFQDDKGGGDIMTNGRCSGNLHSVWDTCLIVKGIWDPIRRADRLPAYANKRSVAHAIVTNWRRSEQTTQMKAMVASWITKSEVWQWAQEGYDLTLAAAEPLPNFTDNQYCYKQASECAYNETQTKFERAKPARRVQIDDAYIASFAPVAETRIRQAAYRLAWVMNNTLDPSWDRQLPRCSESANNCPNG